jgi:hypothetical protein
MEREPNLLAIPHDARAVELTSGRQPAAKRLRHPRRRAREDVRAKRAAAWEPGVAEVREAEEVLDTAQHRVDRGERRLGGAGHSSRNPKRRDQRKHDPAASHHSGTPAPQSELAEASA